MERERILEFVRDDIKPVYFENAVAWALNNCDIVKREDVPQIFGKTAVQRAFADYIMSLIGEK